MVAPMIGYSISKLEKLLSGAFNLHFAEIAIRDRQRTSTDRININIKIMLFAFNLIKCQNKSFECVLNSS